MRRMWHKVIFYTEFGRFERAQSALLFIQEDKLDSYLSKGISAM